VPASLTLQSEAPSAPAPTANYLVYTVAGDGEWVRDIAQRTLGNSDAWTQIRDLNPELNPSAKIAGTTRLRMPPGARVQ
jgi:hypothetical protein